MSFKAFDSKNANMLFVSLQSELISKSRSRSWCASAIIIVRLSLYSSNGYSLNWGNVYLQLGKWKNEAQYLISIHTILIAS